MDLIITKMEDKDYSTFYTWYKDPAYAPFFRHVPDNLDRDMLKVIFTVAGALIRIDVQDKQMIGLVSVAANAKTNIADVGVIVDKDNRQKGIGSLITKAIVKYLFTEGTIQRVVMHATEPSIIAALKKGGLFEECRMYKNAFYNGKLHTESRLVITRDFYRKGYTAKGEESA